MSLLFESARSILLNLVSSALYITQMEKQTLRALRNREIPSKLRVLLNAVFVQKEVVVRAGITIMDATRAGAGGTAMVPFRVIMYSARRRGAGWHTRVATEAGLPVADGRIANGHTTTKLQNVAKETARPVVVAVNVGIRGSGRHQTIERILNGTIRQ